MARVLSHPSSVEACRKAGISDDNIVSGRGPFSVRRKSKLLSKSYGIGGACDQDQWHWRGVSRKNWRLHVLEPAVSSSYKGRLISGEVADSLTFLSLVKELSAFALSFKIMRNKLDSIGMYLQGRVRIQLLVQLRSFFGRRDVQ